MITISALALLLAAVVGGGAVSQSSPEAGKTPVRRAGARAASVTEQAEQLAAESRALLASSPAQALERARRGLALTEEFVPTEFVKAGRKGEVVEDEFVAARAGYARHRALLYEAVGSALAATGEPLPASRYLRRAFLLDASPSRGLALARALVALGRGREAVDAVGRATAGFSRLDPAGAALLAQAADVAGLPSAQAEIDRGRLAALGKGVEIREGPLQLPAGTRLSNAPVFSFADAPLTLLYAAEASCRSCSADLEDLARAVPKDVRVIALPPGDDQDAALRQVIALYRRPWPILLGRDLAGQLRLEARSALLVARGGWTLAVLRAPFQHLLPPAIAALQRTWDPLESTCRHASLSIL